MKVLFVHDGPLYTDGKGAYFGISFNDPLRMRYLQLGSEITFMTRVKLLEQNTEGRYSLIRNENFNVISIPNFKGILLYLKNKKEAENIIEKAVLEQDIIVARLPSATGAMAVKYAHKYMKPLLVEYVGCTFDAYWNFNWKGKIIAFYKMLQQKSIMRKVPYSIYVTKDFLQRRYPTYGHYISCSDVELKEMQQSQLLDRLRNITERDNSKPLLLATLAAIDVRYKGQADVIKAIAQLKKERIFFRYHIVGKGDSTYLKEIIKKYDVEDLVTIVGALKHEEVFEFLSKIDLYIQPSRTEGLPRAPIEAMSLACPVLGSNAGGIPELIGEDMIFKAGDIGDIAQKLKMVNKELMLKHAKRNFEEAKLYQKRVLAERRLDFYKRFLLENKLPLPKTITT
jgi:glycosyltransferase involved in cell wall biosynthesis